MIKMKHLLLLAILFSQLSLIHSKVIKKNDVIVDTDLGGGSDNLQSLFKLLCYSDFFNIDGYQQQPEAFNFKKSEFYLITDKDKSITPYELFNVPGYKSLPVAYARLCGKEERVITIMCKDKIKSFSISPKRLNIKVTKKGNLIRFVLPADSKIALTINDYPTLFLFPENTITNAKETTMTCYNVSDYGIVSGSLAIQTKNIQRLIDSIAQKGGGELFFPQGTYFTGTIYMRDGVYINLHPEAIISGSMNIEDYPLETLDMEPGWPKGVSPDTDGALFIFKDVKNCGIYGGGVINANGAVFRRANLPNYRWLNIIRTINSKNISFDDIYLIDAIGWNTHLIRSDSIFFNNVKVINEIPPIGWNPQVPDGFWNNTDGINPDASSNVFINNCFAHCGDDCITIKITNSQKGEQKDVRNIRVTNSMFISSTGALKAGSESLGATISGVYFKNIDILNMRSGYPLKITPRDKSYLSDIVFENVWCEQEKGLFLECRIMEPRSKEQTWHPLIENIYLKDIHLLNDKVNVLIKGYDDNHIVKNIHFDKIFINNRQIKSFPKGWITKNDFVRNITLNKN
jgi:hypothetical protein